MRSDMERSFLGPYVGWTRTPDRTSLHGSRKGFLLREHRRARLTVHLERDVLDADAAGRVVVDLAADLEASDPHLRRNTGLLDQPVEDRLHVDLAREVVGRAAVHTKLAVA